MEPLTTAALHRLGDGEPIDAICRALKIPREELIAGWRSSIAARVPAMSGVRRGAVRGMVEIERDRRGVPHVYAGNDADLFFGLGYAMAQDRLFQLDWLRRKGAGRLAEILGNEGLANDILARTVGLNRIAQAELEQLPDETRRLIEAFSDGVNAVIDHCRDNPPIEFDLLDYRPEPWSALDCLLIENEFRWYLTGRFPVIAMPELARRYLRDEGLYRAFLTAEAGDECILAETDYERKSRGTQPVGQAVGDPGSAIGSNNWVIGGQRSQSGMPTVASDPHIAFEAVSCWYQVHLQGGSFDVAGCTYVGMPAVLIGRNRRVTWGITNNICSLRDLYQEQTTPEHPGCFLYDGEWQPARELTELIHVRGFGPISRRIVFSHNGPIVDDILPEPAKETGPVSLKWLGAFHGGWLTALLGMNRATDGRTFREAMRPWHIPTFSVVFADVDGNIGYQASGRIPVRKHWARGYRPGWDPEHQWQGLIPFEGMPATSNPKRGYVVTANNRVASDDYPYPLSGTWANGGRARRIRQQIESGGALERAFHAALHQDARSLRAVECLPALCAVLSHDPEPRVQRALPALRDWSGDCAADLVAPALFNVFFVEWCRRVAAERLPGQAVDLLAAGIEGLAAELLQADVGGWFAHGDRDASIRDTFYCTLDWLAARLGDDPSQWTWGRLHRLELKHVLAGRGELGALLNHGGAGVRGDATTVCNTGRGQEFEAPAGAGYRMICDLGESPAGLWAIDCQSQSGHPGSPHYSDQFRDWLEGRYHFIPLDRREAQKAASTTLRLERG